MCDNFIEEETINKTRARELLLSSGISETDWDKYFEKPFYDGNGGMLWHLTPLGETLLTR